VSNPNRVFTSLGNSGLYLTVFAWNRAAEGNGDLHTLICVLAIRLGRFPTLSNAVLWQLNGGLSWLHSADEDAVSWLTNWVHDMCTRRTNSTLSIFLSFAVFHPPFPFILSQSCTIFPTTDVPWPRLTFHAPYLLTWLVMFVTCGSVIHHRPVFSI